MNVRELMEKLSRLPEEANVFVFYDGGFSHITDVVLDEEGDAVISVKE